MSRNSKKKKSTSKYREFKVSPLIAVTAIIEVLVLIVVSTYSWFYLSENKDVNIGTISVDADSGLDIDFKYAREDDYINIWNYVDKDFRFEPVTSLDGRNVFVPTSGTFENTSTSNMVFREGTVNDINSKYINIDFELTNTTDYDMKVFLNNNSYFNVKHGNDKDESRALRMAFYPNDASTGKVTSQLIGTSSDYSGQEGAGTAQGQKTVYFDNTTWSGNQASKTWDRVYAYIWNSSTNTPYAAWPGVEISRMSGSIYSYSFTDTSNEYNKIIFNNGVGSQTGNLNLTNGNVYTASSSGSGNQFKSRTVYFVKPESWDKVYVHAWRNTNLSGTGTDQYYTNWDNGASGLDEMKSVGSGIYSYTYSYGDTAADRVFGLLFTNGTKSDASHQYTQTEDIEGASLVNDAVYYTDAYGSGYKYTTSRYTTASYSSIQYKTIYFFNSLGWTTPYIHAMVGLANISLPMTTLGGNVYYCNVPDVYTSIYFKDRVNGSDVSGHRTYAVPGSLTLQSGYVYRPINEKDGSGFYKMNSFRYADYTSANGYAVISPGVSAGFQRTYSPVVKINNESGAAAEVIPAFSNSIDNYIFGNQAGDNGASQTVFEIGGHHMISLSMVIWLEGTDPACTAQAYAGNNIEMRLEFASSYTDGDGVTHDVNTYGSDTYKYKFYDKTREVWTSDRQATESGITVAPVMQLYDNTVKRGYLMSPESYVTVDGRQKVSCWSVDAPQNIALWGHDIIFRRVNPYDEDEVWNYWHAGRVAGAENDPVYTDRKNTNTYTVYSVATAGTTDTISFTAFADGSPTRSMLTSHGNTTTQANTVPVVSCGGLWGNHRVRTLTLVDGYAGHGLKNNSGLMTMDYYYRYSGGGRTRKVQIEYKSSGPNNTIFYYFVVPDVMYTATDYQNSGTGLTVRFKRYSGYDSGYAINSDRNDEIKWEATFDAGKPTGDYFELSQRSDGVNSFYWGSDMLYVETTNDTKDYCFSGNDKGAGKNKLLQAHFYVTNASGNSKYAYLYAVDDPTIKGAAPTAFVAVVPNDQQYTGYRIECCNWDAPTNDAQKFFTDGHEVKRDLTISVAATNGDSGAAKTFNRCYLNNKNICKLDWFREIRIFFQTNNSAIDNRGSGLPYIYLYTDGGSSYNWPGAQMNYISDVGNNRKKYISPLFKTTTYNKAIFNGGDNTKQTKPASLDLCSNGVIYECDSINGNPTAVGKENGYYNDVIESNTWATNNSHFAPNTN